MSDSLERVSGGQRWHPPAAEKENLTTDAINDFLRRRGALAGPIAVAPDRILRMLNTSDTAFIDQFGVAGIGDLAKAELAITPAESEQDFRNAIIFNVAPPEPGEPFAIMLEPLEASTSAGPRLGKAKIVGEVQCLVDMAANVYAQGSPVTFEGSTYVETAAAGSSTAPPGPSWTEVTSGPGVYVAGQTTVTGQDVSSGGSEWIWTRASSTTTAPSAGNGWIQVVGGVASAPAFAEPPWPFADALDDNYENLGGNQQGPARVLWSDTLPALAREDGATVLTGGGPPSRALGVDGNYYVDRDDGSYYGPKEDGEWGSAQPNGSGIVWAVVVLAEDCCCACAGTVATSPVTSGGGGNTGGSGSCTPYYPAPMYAHWNWASLATMQSGYGDVVPADFYANAPTCCLLTLTSTATAAASGSGYPTGTYSGSVTWTSMSAITSLEPVSYPTTWTATVTGQVAAQCIPDGMTTAAFLLTNPPLVWSNFVLSVQEILNTGSTSTSLNITWTAPNIGQGGGPNYYPAVGSTTYYDETITGAMPFVTELWVNGVACAGAVTITSGPAGGLPIIGIGGVGKLGITGTVGTASGSGFSNTAIDNAVTLYPSGTATVTASTATTLTLALSGITGSPPFDLLAKVVVTDPTGGTASSGNFTKIATIVADPTVTSTTTAIGANAENVLVTGAGFDPNPAGNVVTATTLSATAGVPIAADPGGDWLIVPVSGIVGTGALDVTLSSFGSAPTTATEVANVTGSTGPLVNLDMGTLQAAAPTMVISGSDFNATPADNTLVFNNGAVGTAGSGSSTTALVVTLSTQPAATGPLTVVVTDTSTSRTSGAPVTVATVQAGPVITPATTSITQGTPTYTFAGTDLAVKGQATTITLSSGVFAVASASSTSITGRFTTAPTLGVLTASASVGGNASRFVEIAVVAAASAPVVTANTTNQANTAPTLLITGSNLAQPTGVVFSAAASPATGHVISVNPSGTAAVILYDSLPANIGKLDIVYSTLYGGNSGAAVEVANIVAESAPTLTANPATYTSGVWTITGTGFDATTANNVVSTSSGRFAVIGATSTVLTGYFADAPDLGNVTASVVVNGVGSGAPIQIATASSTLAPVVMPGTAHLLAAATAVTLFGGNFDPNAANDSVTLSGTAGPTGGAVTAATATQLTVSGVTLTGNGTVLAVVATTIGNSGAAVQVAAVTGAPPASTTVNTTGSIPPIGDTFASVLVVSQAGFSIGDTITIISAGVTWKILLTSVPSGNLLAGTCISIVGGVAFDPYFNGDPVTN